MQGLRTGLTARWASSHSYNHMHGVKDHPPPPIPLTPCSLWEARRFAVSFAPKRLLQCEMALPGGRPPSSWWSAPLFLAEFDPACKEKSSGPMAGCHPSAGRCAHTCITAGAAALRDHRHMVGDEATEDEQPLSQSQYTDMADPSNPYKNGL